MPRNTRIKRLIFAMAGLGLFSVPHAMAEGNAANGETIFQRCLACHTNTPGTSKVGPSLFGVIGRNSGSVAGFRYSASMKNAGVVWAYETLEPYLKNPREFIPGVRMNFRLNSKQDRDDVIAYLKLLN